MRRVVLLDVGNTLAFLDMDAVARVAHSAGVPVAGHELARVEGEAKRRYGALLASGLSHEAAWDLYFVTLLCAAGRSEGQARSVLPALHLEHGRQNLWRRMPEELPAALERARARGVRLGIVSNSEGLSELLAELGIAHLFEVVVDSHHEGVRKPDPEIFQRALARMGVQPDACVYLGDIPDVDVGGANAAGIVGVLVDPLDFYCDFEGVRVPSVAAYLEEQLG
jgi:HAD superfamily hydrolase (TIGR01662 family)